MNPEAESDVTRGSAAGALVGDGAALVEEHLAKLPEPQQGTLRSLRAMLVSVLPHGEECIKYRMPAIAVQGKGVAAYDGFSDHCSYFPMSGSVLANVTGIPNGAATSQGTLQFPIDKPLSLGLVRKLVKARLTDISDVTNGKRFEFYADGAVKAEGSMKDGLLNGKWVWYRTDGSVMRIGSFRSGVQTGTWETFDADGNLVSSKTH
jgi:uncharacterized protein YdhG (YjbR/CyaY superfamily)